MIAIRVNEQCLVRTNGFPQRTDDRDGFVYHACVTLELGAITAALGVFSVHLDPKHARQIAAALIAEADVAEGQP